MLQLLGLVILCFSGYLLEQNQLIVGSVLLFVGGFLSKMSGINFLGAGLVMFGASAAYGYHNQFDPLIMGLMGVGAVLFLIGQNHHSRSGVGGGDGGFEFDFFDGGSDGGGDGDGGD
ncbi:hypothetical protein [Pelagibaculum spongiae]|uniref:Uncharacterized protein n=1 Tax=Pelagibaculum spongiae TaxID=2080658 RepID=A0A2V1GT39_9GAMM|nr:hypothetical protein [Pelagibaculum spongiae]PVZ68184.1 hypothetical protein DC094_12855 [Pelagibaculum spongiae]